MADYSASSIDGRSDGSRPRSQHPGGQGPDPVRGRAGGGRDRCRVSAWSYVMNDFSREEKALEALAPPIIADDSGAVSGPATAGEPAVDFVKLKRGRTSIA